MASSCARLKAQTCPRDTSVYLHVRQHHISPASVEVRPLMGTPWIEKCQAKVVWMQQLKSAGREAKIDLIHPLHCWHWWPGYDRTCAGTRPFDSTKIQSSH